MLNYSFIIPHHNSPDLLNRCIASIPQREDLEIIVVDDNSDDNKKPNVERNDVHVILLDKNESKGAGKARNIGIEKAKGKWLLFADADDYYNDGFLNVLDTFKDDDIELLYFNYLFISEDGKKLSHPVISHIKQYCKDGTGLDYIKYKNFTPWDKMVKKDFVYLYNCSFECLPSGNDMFFSFQIAYFAKSIKVVDKPLYNYIMYKHSQTNRNWDAQKVFISLRRHIRRNFFYNYIGLGKWDYNIVLTILKDIIIHDSKLVSLKKICLYFKYHKRLNEDKGYYVSIIQQRKNKIDN